MINECWVVKDSDGTRFSTNGTWYTFITNYRLFNDDDFEIFQNMKFKAGQTLFKVAII